MQYPHSSVRIVALALLSALPLTLPMACTPAPSDSRGAGGNGAGGSNAGGAGGKTGPGGGGSGGTSATGGQASGGSGGNAGAGGRGSGSNPQGGSAAGGSGGNAGGDGKAGAGGSNGGAGGNLGGAGGAAGAGGAGGSGGRTGGAGGGQGGSPGSGGTAGGAGGSGVGASSGGAGGAAGAGGSTTGGQGGGTSTMGGNTGTGGGSPSGLCATAFFSTEAAGRKTAEYSTWKTTYVQECTSNNSAVVKNGGGVYSEGIGYGMLLAANNDDQKLFDKLWKFYMDHLDPNGLMNWSMDACTAPGNNNANAASDGDLDAAMGLVIADKVWGGYQAQALELIAKIKKYETDSCANGLVVLRPGDKFGGCTESASKGRVNPSYFSPGYYRAFATVDTANADFWTKLAADSYTLLAQYQKAMNGLVPEWGFSDGSAESSSYDYNACRTPWRVAMDYMWYCTPEAKTSLELFSKFVDGKGGVTKTGYANNSAFIGAFANSGVGISQSKIDTYVKDWMGNTSGDDTPYFQATLRRLYLLVAGGQALSGR